MRQLTGSESRARGPAPSAVDGPEYAGYLDYRCAVKTREQNVGEVPHIFLFLGNYLDAV